MVMVETGCDITHEGRTFSAGGAVVTPDYATVYLKGADARSLDKGIVTDWHGATLGTYVVVSTWPNPRGYVSTRMVAIEARIDGVLYTGRGCGNGCSCNLKRKARQSLLDHPCNR